MKTIVVGAGLIGARHIEAVRNHGRAKLVGVVEPDARGFTASDVPRFESVAQVDVPVDAAICAVPTQLHASIGAECAARGWAILMEKPIAGSLEEADALISACKEVPLLIGQHRRHHFFVEEARDIIQSGRIGALVAVNGIWSVRKPDGYFAGNWRSGASGSPVSINLVHDLDLMRFMVGEVVDVCGILSQAQRARGVEDSGAVALRFACGAVGSFLFSDAGASPWSFEAASSENPNIAASGQDCYHFIGTKGAFSFPSLTVWDGAENWSQAQKHRKITVPEVHPLERQLDHFCDVAQKGAKPIVGGEDARKTLALVEAVMALGG